MAKGVIDESKKILLTKELIREEHVKQGKKNKRSGGEFEMKVRRELEADGWIVSKWQNNIEIEGSNDGVTWQPVKKEKFIFYRGVKLIPAKHAFNPFRRAVTLGTGFPDFVCFQYAGEDDWRIKLVESKVKGYLDAEERAKVEWIKENIKIPVFVAKKTEGGIDYEEK